MISISRVNELERPLRFLENNFVADFQIETFLSVRGQRHFFRRNFRANRAVGGEDERTRGEEVRIDRGQNYRVEIRVENRSARGKRVRRRAGRGRDDRAVRVKSRNFFSVEIEVERDQFRDAILIQNELVQRDEIRDDFFISQNFRGNQNSRARFEFPGEKIREQFFQFFRREFRQKSERPVESDPREFSARAEKFARRAEQRAVAAENQNQIRAPNFPRGRRLFSQNFRDIFVEQNCFFLPRQKFQNPREIIFPRGGILSTDERDRSKISFEHARILR